MLSSSGVESIFNAVDLVVGCDDDKHFAGDVSSRLGESNLFDINCQEIRFLNDDRRF